MAPEALKTIPCARSNSQSWSSTLPMFAIRCNSFLRAICLRNQKNAWDTKYTATEQIIQMVCELRLTITQSSMYIANIKITQNIM